MVQKRPVYPPLLDALLDDLNTPKAIAEIHSLRNAIVHDAGHTTVTALTDSLRFLGLLRDNVSNILDWDKTRAAVDKEQIEALIAARNAARKAKDFKEADRIRDELVAMRVVLKDSKDGTTWESAR